MRKVALVAALMASAFMAIPQSAEACNRGHYEYKTVCVREWVPARTVRYQTQEWVPGRVVYVSQTRVIRAGYWRVDNCGRRAWIAPITQCVRVPRQEPGCYRTVWRTKTIPGFYQNVRRQVRVWVNDCRCRSYTPRTRVRVTVPAHRVGKEIRRSGRKIDKERRRVGRKINKGLKRIFS